MKIIYIAHPIAGDVPGNIAKILEIVKLVNLAMPDVVPFAPYLVDCMSLDDSIPEQRARGMANNVALFKAGFISEVWLCGDRISAGMAAEKALAEELGITVQDWTTNDLQQLLKDGEIVHLTCEVCSTKFYGVKPQMCCDGYMCGCHGGPIDPVICSEACYHSFEVPPIITPLDILKSNNYENKI